MWANQQSIAKEKLKLSSFIPPFCANPNCAWHKPENIKATNPFQKFGTKKIARYPYFSQRYRCKRCLVTFTGSFFTLQYRDRQKDCYEEIHDLLLMGFSGRDAAKQLRIDEDTLRRRKKKLARWALLRMAYDQATLKIRESVAFDGLENFAYSQYDPNNVNHAVGRESNYIYDFNLSIMNRKGRMSARQEKINAQLVEAFGKYDTKSIQKDSKKIFDRLLAKCDGDLILHTDNHYAYRRAIALIFDKERIVHLITPAKLARNFKNRLFAINHTDLLTRQKLAAYKRETISFAKHAVSMMETFTLFAARKNYLLPRFSKKHARDLKAHIESPAMHLGLRTKIQSFKEFYRIRISFHHVRLNEDWMELFDSNNFASRRTIRAYAGI